MTIEVQWFLEGIWRQYKVKKIHFTFQGFARRMNTRVAKACNFLFPHFGRHVIVPCYEIEAILNRQILSKNFLGTWNEFSSLCIVIPPSFLLAMSWNVKWIFFTLYCLQRPSENHWSSNFISLILYLMYCFAYLHDFSLKNTKNTYEVARFMIKLNTLKRTH